MAASTDTRKTIHITPVEKEFVMEIGTNSSQNRYTLLGIMAEGVEYLVINEPDNDRMINYWTDDNLKALQVITEKPSSLKDVTLAIKRVLQKPGVILQTLNSLTYQSIRIGLNLRGCPTKEVIDLLGAAHRLCLSNLNYLELSNFEMSDYLPGIIDRHFFKNLKVVKLGLAHNYDDITFANEMKDLQPFLEKLSLLKLEMIILDFEDGIALKSIEKLIKFFSTSCPETTIKVSGQVVIYQETLEWLVKAASGSNSRRVFLDVTVRREVLREGKKYLQRQRIKTNFESTSSSSLQDLSSQMLEKSDLSASRTIFGKAISEKADFCDYYYYYLNRDEPDC